MNITNTLRRIVPSRLWNRAASIRKLVSRESGGRRWTFGTEQPSAFYDERFAQKGTRDEHYSRSTTSA
jgi:hypothetical protein